MAQKLASVLGLEVGISSGGNLIGASYIFISQEKGYTISAEEIAYLVIQ